MATLNFYLEKADKNGLSIIQMTYLANGQKFRFSLKIKISPDIWLKKKQRVKAKTQDHEYLNAHLSSIEEVIRKAERESLLTHSCLNFIFIKQKFDDTLNKKSDRRSLVQYFREFIERADGKKTVGTIKHYKTCLNHLTKFSKAKRYELTFERINSTFNNSFTSYLSDDCKLLNNTVGNYVKIFKAFMSFATENGYNKATDDFKKFKVFKEDGELIYLTESELLKIYQLELKTEKLKVVRDNFCFACFTGLRYSDIAKLKAENIKADFIEIRSEKTRDLLKIPLNIYTKELLKKNGGLLPKMFSNQKTNEYLKEIGKLAELNEMISVVKYRGVTTVEFLEPKYKFLCTHTARRSFVTLSLEKGMRPETVMSITGHKDYKTFKKYIKLTDNVKLVEMNNIWSKKLYIA
jgi:integrase